MGLLFATYYIPIVVLHTNSSSTDFVVSPIEVGRVRMPFPLAGFGEVTCFAQWNMDRIVMCQF